MFHTAKCDLNPDIYENEEGEDMKDGREYGAQPGHAIPWSVPRRSQGLT